MHAVLAERREVSFVSGRFAHSARLGAPCREGWNRVVVMMGLRWGVRHISEGQNVGGRGLVILNCSLIMGG